MSLAAGIVPDVTYGEAYVNEFVQLGIYNTVSDEAAQQFPAGTVARATVDGKVYGLPMSSGANVLFAVWQGIGFTVIFFLAGLQGIDENLYDAAKIDGANGRQLLWYITIPQMLPVLLFISVTGMIGSMQMWEVPKIITAGGPDNLTYTLIYSIHNDSFGALEMGLGTAQSFVLFIVLLVFIGWQLNEYRKQYGV